MLLRDLGGALQVVLQPDHGDLCGQLAAAWRYDSSLDERLRSALILAAARHDDGWSVWERHPHLDGDGRPQSFLTAPHEPLLSSYSAAVDVLGIEDLLAALLVSRHVTGLRRGRYGVLDGEDELDVEELDGPVRDFVGAEEARQERLGAELAAGELQSGRLREAYRLLQIFDVFSLHLGLADLSRETLRTGGLQVSPGPHPDSVRCSPWPFTPPALRVVMRRRVVDADRFPNVAAFRRAFNAAAVEEVPLDLLHG